MTTDENSDRQLDELLEQHYNALRLADPSQRAVVLDAVLDGLRVVVPGEMPSPGRPSRRRWALISAAALVSMASALFLLHWAPFEGAAYGIDGVPDRFQHVQTISIRGWHWTRDPSGLDKPAIPAPFELLVKRPRMFCNSLTTTFVRQGRTEMRQQVMLCDGRRLWSVDGNGDSARLVRTLSPLDARLRTESLAQTATLTAVLGPPGVDYRKIGTDSANGRRCDVYEGRFVHAYHTTVAKVWLDPASGLPVRVTRDELGANGVVFAQSELTEIEVNSPLSDDLFRPRGTSAAAPGSKEGVAEKTKSPPLDTEPTASGSAGEVQLAVWYALRISDGADLVIWRRSAPPRKPDGSRDWLSGLTMTIWDPSGKRAIRQACLDEAEAADRWSWSLVVAADGKPLGSDRISLTLAERGGRMSMQIPALRFPDEELESILTAARQALSGGVSEVTSLAELRKRARELADAK